MKKSPINPPVMYVPAESYTRESYDNYIQELDVLASVEDCAFIKTAFKTASSKDVRVASVTVLSATAHVSMEGEVVVNEDSPFTEVDPWWVRAGSLPDNFKVGNLSIRAGVCAIVGGGGVGKTPLAHALAAHADNYAVVRFSEPFAGYTTSQRECAFQLADALLTHRAVVFDSVKDILAGGGSAMKSGLSRDALTTLSSWSIAAANCGATLFVPVNPSTSDPETIQILIEALRSNVSAVLYSVSPGSWEYSCRTREGGNRTTGTMDTKWVKGRLSIGAKASGFVANATDSDISSGEIHADRLHRSILSSLQPRNA